jgi:hypothetical protein
MEAWLKFKAPGVTLPTGLSVGKLIFNSLNKVEWIFTLIIFFNFFMTNQAFKQLKSLFIIVLICLTIQSIWVLPLLNIRADMIIGGQELSGTYHHLYYVVFEVIKVLCLSIFGIKLLKINYHENY